MENPNLFEKRIHRIGGVDIAIHGVGVNGHLAFNEPDSEANSRTRIVLLAQSTRVANSRFFKELSHVPTHGITVGMATIMETKKIYLLAFGETKKTAMRRALAETASLNNPASILQSHSNTVYVLDVESSSEICAPPQPAVTRGSKSLEDHSTRELVA